MSSFFIRSLMFVKSPEISPFPEWFFFPPQFGNSTKHKLDFKGIFLACCGCHEMQIQMMVMASKEPGRALKMQILSGSQGSQWSRENWDPQDPAGEGKHTSGREQGSFHGFSLDNPSAQPSCLSPASELKWLRGKKKWERSFP